MNRYASHVYVIPEDDRDRQLADGFVLHHQVKDARIQVVPPAGGWAKVLETFCDEYVPKLRDYPKSHIIMLIDFDNHVEERTALFDAEIPAEFKSRVFVIGSSNEPETLKKSLKLGYEEIGRRLADDCAADTAQYWDQNNSGTTMRSGNGWC